MAEQRRNSRSNNSSKRSAREVIEHVRSEFPDLLGKPIEAVLGLDRDDDGWKVMVQVVELGRIPPTTDVLGAYEVTVDKDGEVMGYRRVRRFHRNQADED